MRCRTTPVRTPKFVFVAALCFVASAAVTVSSDRAARATPSSANLVAHWSFDQSSGAVLTDNSGNGYNGTLVNSPTWVAGKLGQALSFSTNRSVSVGNIPAINGVNKLSMSAWIKRGTSNALVLVGKQTSNHDVAIEAWNDGTVYFQLSNGSDASGRVSLNDTNWHHVAFTLRWCTRGKLESPEGLRRRCAKDIDVLRDDPCDDHEQHHGIQHRQDDVRLLEWAGRRCVDLRSGPRVGRDRRPGIDCCCRHDCADRAVRFDRHGAHVFASEPVVDCLD